MKINHITTVETSLMNLPELREYLAQDEPIKTGEYPMFRIPGIVALDDGSLLAYYECRQGDDNSAIDVAMRRSTDGGRTWGERTVLVHGYRRLTNNNPVMIADGSTVYFLHCENYIRLFIRVSHDYGMTWSERRELTDSFDKQIPFAWNVVAIGPGHGAKLSSGRLIVPMWIGYNQMNIYSHRPSYSTSYYSDDCGTTWQVGEIIDLVKNPSEGGVAELSDGTVMINFRNEDDARCRLIAKSKDGGSTWSETYLDKNLPDPICDAGLHSAGNILLFSNCDNDLGLKEGGRARINITLRLSHDDGKTWEKLLIDKLGGYSDVNYSESLGKAYVIYENAEYKYIKIAEIDLNA